MRKSCIFLFLILALFDGCKSSDQPKGKIYYLSPHQRLSFDLTAYDLESKSESVIFPLPSFERISQSSISPNGKYLLLYVTTVDGKEGKMALLSIDSKTIKYLKPSGLVNDSKMTNRYAVWLQQEETMINYLPVAEMQAIGADTFDQKNVRDVYRTTTDSLLSWLSVATDPQYDVYMTVSGADTKQMQFNIGSNIQKTYDEIHHSLTGGIFAILESEETVKIYRTDSRGKDISWKTLRSSRSGRYSYEGISPDHRYIIVAWRTKDDCIIYALDTVTKRKYKIFDKEFLGWVQG